MWIGTDLIQFFSVVVVMDVSPVMIADAVVFWAVQVGG